MYLVTLPPNHLMITINENNCHQEMCLNTYQNEKSLISVSFYSKFKEVLGSSDNILNLINL